MHVHPTARSQDLGLGGGGTPGRCHPLLFFVISGCRPDSGGGGSAPLTTPLVPPTKMPNHAHHQQTYIIQPTYTIHNNNLETTDTAKYIGIHINTTLNWNTHINKTAQRANTTSAFLHRNIRTCPRKTKTPRVLAYTTLVRPILEYMPASHGTHKQPPTCTNLKWYNAARPDTAGITTLDKPASQSFSSI